MRFFINKKKSGRFALQAAEQGSCVAHVLINNAEKSQIKKPSYVFGSVRPESLKDNVATKSLATDLNLANQHCSLLLAYGEYQLLQIEKPNVPANEVKQAVRWKIKNMVDYPVEQATFDVIDIPPDPSNANRQLYVYVVVAKNALISDYIQRLMALSGVALDAIDIPELAQRNIAAFLEKEGHGLAMLSINNDGGLMTFTSGGELYHARHIDVDTKQMQSEDTERKFSIFGRLSLEILRSLDNFERQFPYITISRLVLAPFIGRLDFYDYLKTSLFVPVDCFDLSDIFSSNEDVGFDDLAMQASLLPVLGAALRGNKLS